MSRYKDRSSSRLLCIHHHRGRKHDHEQKEIAARHDGNSRGIVESAAAGDHRIHEAEVIVVKRNNNDPNNNSTVEGTVGPLDIIALEHDDNIRNANEEDPPFGIEV